MELPNDRMPILVALCLLVNMLSSVPTMGEQHEYEGYYLRSYRTYPTKADLGDREIQGVTHDHDNWYFTWTNKDPNIGFLSKIPLGVPLDDCVLGALTPCPKYPNQVIVDMRQYPFLNDNGYWHWGDPDYYKDPASSAEFVVVPISGHEPAIIAIFRTDPLRLVAYGKLIQKPNEWCVPLKTEPEGQKSTGWCAIHPKTGVLYTSEDFDYTGCFPGTCVLGGNAGKTCYEDAGCPGGTCAIDNCNNQDFHFPYRRELLRYSIPWGSLLSGDYVGEIPLTPVEPRLELHGSNDEFLELYNMQGGEFSPSGEMLYISAGSGCCYLPVLGLGAGVGQQYALDGVYAFDTTTWRAIKRSNNHWCDHSQCPTGLPRYFDYYYRLSCDACTLCGGGAWSPEGLTVWGPDGSDPSVADQMHVLLFHCQVAAFTGSCSDNEVAFEHFGGRLFVDSGVGVDVALPASLGDDPLPGGPLAPFRTFGFAYNNYPVWDGAEIILQAGSYPETGRFSTRVRLRSRGGVATIGRK
jgi:hypothetical protein